MSEQMHVYKVHVERSDGTATMEEVPAIEALAAEELAKMNVPDAVFAAVIECDGKPV